DRVAGAQVEPLDLAGRDIDVVGAVQVVPVGAAQEPVAFREDFQDALAPEYGVRVEQRLLDTKDQVLLAEPRVVADVQGFSHRVQFRDGFPLQLSDIHVCCCSMLRRAEPRGGGVGAGMSEMESGESKACEGAVLGYPRAPVESAACTPP